MKLAVIFATVTWTWVQRTACTGVRTENEAEIDATEGTHTDLKLILAAYSADVTVTGDDSY